VGIPTVYSTGMNSVKLFPNPVYNETNVVVNAQVAGTAVLRVYDLNGRVVVDRKLGYVAEGEHSYTLDCTGMNKGMYLVNVIIGGHTSAVKMVVR
jgi:flagellar hook assembly protein FlgD